MKFRARKAIKLGPLRLNFTQKGFSSYSIRVWRYTWNSRTGQSRFDTPGWGGVVWGGKKKAQGKNLGAAARTAPRTGPARRVVPVQPAPYRAARWPYALLGVLLVLAVLGGAVWQSIVLFGGIAAVVALVQRQRARMFAPPAPEPEVAEPEPAPLDPAEAERIVREWSAPDGWTGRPVDLP